MIGRKKQNPDQMIEKIVQSKINSSPKPIKSSEEAWREIQLQLNQAKTKTKPVSPYTKGLLYVASFALIISVFSIIFPSNSSAFVRFTDVFHKFQGTITQVFTKIGNDEDVDGKEAPTKEDDFQVIEGSQIVVDDMSLTEAEAITNFNIVVPRYIPSDFKLRDVTVLRKQNDRSNNIFLNFQEGNKSFKIHQIMVSEQLGAGGIMSSEDTEIEEVTINGLKGTFIKYKFGTTKLIWVTQDMFYTIEGDFSKEEIIQIASSM